MKTQTNKSVVQKALVIAILIAFFAPQSWGQSRRKSTVEVQEKTAVKQRRPVDKQKYKSYSEKEETVAYRNDRQENHYQIDRHKYQHKKQDSRYDNRYWSHKNKYDSHVHIYAAPHLTHRHIEVYPEISFRKLPKKAIWVYLDGESYYVHKGRFYQLSPMGYYRVKPPRFVHHLPEGHSIMWVNGQKVFHYRGILFVDTPFGFKVITS